MRVEQWVHEVGGPIELGVRPQESLDFCWSGARPAGVSSIVAFGDGNVKGLLDLRDVIASHRKGPVERQAEPSAHGHPIIQSINFWKSTPMLLGTRLQGNVDTLIGIYPLDLYGIDCNYIEVARAFGDVVVPELNSQHEFFAIVVSGVEDRRGLGSLRGICH